MINGDPRDFIETIYSGQDVPYSFRGRKYWFQGYNKDGGCHMEVMECFAPYNYLWEYDDSDYQKCGDAFQKAPIFDFIVLIYGFIIVSALYFVVFFPLISLLFPYARYHK